MYREPFIVCRGDELVSDSFRGAPRQPVRLLVPLGEFEKNHFLPLVVDVVQNAIRSDSQPIFGSELREDDLTREFLCPFSLRSGVRRERSDSGDDGVLVVGGDLGESPLKRALDSRARKDDFVAQLESHSLEESLSRDGFALGILTSGFSNLP